MPDTESYLYDDEAGGVAQLFDIFYPWDVPNYPAR